MNRRERRRRARERKKIEETLKKESSQRHTESRDAKGLSLRAKHYFWKSISRAKLLSSLFLAGLALAGGYASLRPHVSVEPDVLLNPANPFSTKFKITNENPIFPVYDLASSCWTESLGTSNNIGIWDPSGATAKPVQHRVPMLGPRKSSAIDCAPIMGGLGSYMGNAVHADIKLTVSYKQSWWPSPQAEDYPFRAVPDSQGVARWVPITPSEQTPPFLK